MSHPKLLGKIQSPCCSMDTATMASRGSPLVLNGVMPSQGRNVMARMINSIATECRRNRSVMLIAGYFFMAKICKLSDFSLSFGKAQIKNIRIFAPL